jgi:hypothetical protein
MQRTSNWVPGEGPVMGEIDRLYREARAQNERLRAENERLRAALTECEEKRHAAQSDR